MLLLLIVRTAFEKMSHRVPEGGGLNVVDVQVHQRIRPSVALVRAVALATGTPTIASSSWRSPRIKPRRTPTLIRIFWMPCGCCVGQTYSGLVKPVRPR